MSLAPVNIQEMANKRKGLLSIASKKPGISLMESMKDALKVKLGLQKPVSVTPVLPDIKSSIGEAILRIAGKRDTSNS